MQFPLCSNTYDEVTSVDFTLTQKSRYLEDETLFSLQIKKFINYTSRANNSFVAEVTFKDSPRSLVL